MNHTRINKESLEQIINLHIQALTAVPTNHPIYNDMAGLLRNLQERLETYDDFDDNPYKNHTSLPKYNSDDELSLGEYDVRL